MSSRSPRPISADLAAANATLDLCAALLRAQGDDIPQAAPEPAPAPPARDEQREAALARVAELETAASSITTSFAGGDPCGTAAAAIADCSGRAIAAARATLSVVTAPAPEPSAPPLAAVQRDYKTQRALRAAIDRYFSYFEVPGTSWRLDWRLFGEGGMPTATAFSSSPTHIEAVHSIALPEDPPWRAATKLTAIEAAPSKATSILASGAKPTPLAKYFLAGLSWSAGSGSITLSRSKKKLANSVRVDYPGDGTVSVTPLDATGNATGPAASQDGETTGYLDAIWWKICASAMGLIHARGDAISLTHEGTPIETHPTPVRVATAIMVSSEALLSKVDSEIDDEMRAKLASKFDDTPERYRSRFDGLTLAEGSNPPSFAAATPAEAPKVAPSPKEAPKETPIEAAAPIAPDAPPAKPTKPVVVQPTPMPDYSEPDSEPTKPERVSPNVVARRPPVGSGPVPNPGGSAKMVVSRPDESGVRLFGQKTIDEKFDGLDLEIDWDDEDDDAPTQMKGRDPNEQTLPGVTPSIRRPTTVTIER